MKLFARAKKERGWLVVDESPEVVKFVHGALEPGAVATLETWGDARIGAHASLERIAKERHFERYRCATLLHPGEYQLIQVDAPNVPPDELKSAIRWSIKDMLDYHVDDATLDVLDVPPESTAHGHTLFAVAARNETIQQRIRTFEEARIPLQVIDIPETAQRNIAALYEADKRGTALLFLDSEWGLLTINYRGELYLARRLDIGIAQIAKYAPENRQDVLGRIQLELQRTFDHFDRQHGLPIAKLVLGPEPEDTGLEAFLQANFDIPIERVDLAARLRAEPASGFDAAAQWRMFHLAGASLRQETRAL